LVGNLAIIGQRSLARLAHANAVQIAVPKDHLGGSISAQRRKRVEDQRLNAVSLSRQRPQSNLGEARIGAEPDRVQRPNELW
jgi:hypothetical protein